MTRRRFSNAGHISIVSVILCLISHVIYSQDTIGNESRQGHALLLHFQETESKIDRQSMREPYRHHYILSNLWRQHAAIERGAIVPFSIVHMLAIRSPLSIPYFIAVLKEKGKNGIPNDPLLDTFHLIEIVDALQGITGQMHGNQISAWESWLINTYHIYPPVIHESTSGNTGAGAVDRGIVFLAKDTADLVPISNSLHGHDLLAHYHELEMTKLARLSKDPKKCEPHDRYYTMSNVWFYHAAIERGLATPSIIKELLEVNSPLSVPYYIAVLKEKQPIPDDLALDHFHLNSVVNALHAITGRSYRNDILAWENWLIENYHIRPPAINPIQAKE